MHEFSELQNRIQIQIAQKLTLINQSPPLLAQAIQYTCLSGGKFLRPIIVHLIGDSLNCREEKLDAPACAIELIHTYSLIHDDLPCMDDAKFRRGKPSCHEAFDEATAVLVGDALQSLAFEIICEDPHLEDSEKVHMISVLSKAIGPNGMVAGQILDLTPTETTLSREALNKIHELKTGRLISAAAEFGLIASQCENMKIIAAVRNYASTLGLAYQVQDDVLDYTSDVKTLGKPTQQDKDKQSFISIMSIEDAKKLVEQLCQHAITQIQILDKHADNLIKLTELLIARRY